jgi:PelA/Pel-15E family pectate lyase
MKGFTLKEERMKKLLNIFLSLILLLSVLQNAALTSVSAAEPTEIPAPTGVSAVSKDSQVDVSWDPLVEGKRVLLVGTGIPADEKTMAHLKSLGYSVTFKKDNEVTTEDALAYDVVFVGESSGSSYIGKKFMNSPVPVVYAEPYALDDIHLSDASSGTFGSYENQDSLTIKDGNHPLSAGLSGTVKVYNQAGKVNFGKPSQEAIIIATAADDPTKATIFAYEKGAKNVNGDPVPARQVATFLFAGQEEHMTEAGWNLVDESVKWALGIEENDSVSKVTYNVKRSATQEGPFQTIAEKIEGTRFQDTGLTNGTTYYYVVSAVTENGESVNSNVVSAVPTAPDPSNLPSAPKGLTALSRNSQVDVSWEPSSAQQVTYNLKRSTTQEGPYQTIAEKMAETDFRDTGLENGQKYYYVVSAETSSGESADSQAITAVSVAPLQAPTGLSASHGNGGVTIHWESVNGAESYQVLRSKQKGIGYEVIKNGVTETSYTDTGIPDGEKYYYVVSAKNDTAESANSQPINGTAVSTSGVPAIPNGMNATAGDGRAALTWSAVSGADSYTIKRGEFNSGQYEVIAKNIHSTGYQDIGLTNGDTYDYVISAVNEQGESLGSEPISVTPAKVTIVAKEGGDFNTIQEAIDAAPDNSTKRHVIYIKNGQYREKLTIPKSKTNLSFVGESKEGTVLVYNDNANTPGPDGKPLGTSNSSSIFIYANDFIAQNLTIQNDSGQGTGQAVAAYVRADRLYFENVQFLGYQDTLYAHTGRQYYKNCYVEGDVDFIFGGATAMFDTCHLHSKRTGSKLTAASTDQVTPYGYVFLDSKITSDEGVTNVHLGRPWRPYSAVTYINTEMDASIVPDGWDNWGKVENEKTARYSEYNNMGPGADPKKRDPWTTQLTPEEANQYTVQNVMKGSDGWDPERIGIIPLSPLSAPIISLDKQDSIVNTPSFTITGQVDKEAAVSVNGKEISLQKDGSFSTTVVLNDGLNTITVEAVDAAGNQAIPAVLKVVYDHEKPVVSIDDLKGEKNGNHYNVIYNPLPITGKLNEAGTVMVNGEKVNVSEKLTFSTKVILKPGLNNITITAVDQAGNEAESVTINVVPKGNAVPDGPVKIIKSETTNANTVEVTFNSKLENFDSSDIALQTATNDWAALNPGLKPLMTVESITTKVNKDNQTVAVIKTKEAFQEDGTITLPKVEDPFHIQYLNADYYTGDRTQDIKHADALLTWQMDHGGWFKNWVEKYKRPWDGKEPKSEWYSTNHGELGTIDNDATTNEILFLALMYKETGDARYKESVLKGIDFLLEMQVDAGGWPQVYPARGGYSDYVTFNDNAMVRVMSVLTMVKEKKYPFNSNLGDKQLSEQIDDALGRGLDYILKSQIKVDGEVTAWCAQHDPVTYEPKGARAYEHPSISGSESVGIVQYLMSLPNPSTEVQAAVHGALNWFEEAKLAGTKYVSGDPNGQYFYPDESSNTWYRFYEIGTNRPIFSGRDGVIKHNILEIEKERRDGYRWAGEWPQKLLNIANTTGYYENRVYVEVVGDQSKNAAGESLEIGNLYRIEASASGSTSK